MNLLGSWRVEVVEGGNVRNIELSRGDLMFPTNFPQMAYEDWCTDDIGVSKYDEIRFVFVPSPKVWDEDGEVRPNQELYQLLDAEKDNSLASE